MARSEVIQKALKFGIGICSQKIVEDLYPLQREMNDHKNNLTKGIIELDKQKIQKMRIY